MSTPYVTRSHRTIPLFLILFLIVTNGCTLIKSTTPKATPFDGKWQLIMTPEDGMMACLSERDIDKLRETLIRCDSGQQ